jgi:hypothetical protein
MIGWAILATFSRNKFIPALASSTGLTIAMGTSLAPVVVIAAAAAAASAAALAAAAAAARSAAVLPAFPVVTVVAVAVADLAVADLEPRAIFSKSGRF